MPSQGDLLEPDLTPTEVLRRAIEEQPKARLHGAAEWHIGRPRPLDAHGRYFAFGRLTKQTMSLWDEKARDFQEQEFPAAPYTHVVLDLRTQVCAIAAKRQLAGNTNDIASRLARVLNKSKTADQLSVSFKVEPLRDPVTFITHLRTAHAIKSFTVSVRPPNPYDSDKLFHAPFQNAVREARGKQGTATITGDDLDRDVTVALAQSAAACQEKASARIIPKPGHGALTKRLRGSVVTLKEDVFVVAKDAKSLIKKLSRAVRNRDTARIEHGILEMALPGEREGNGWHM